MNVEIVGVIIGIVGKDTIRTLAVFTRPVANSVVALSDPKGFGVPYLSVCVVVSHELGGHRGDYVSVMDEPPRRRYRLRKRAGVRRVSGARLTGSDGIYRRVTADTPISREIKRAQARNRRAEAVSGHGNSGRSGAQARYVSVH